jgi:hypothetical protein
VLGSCTGPHSARIWSRCREVRAVPCRRGSQRCDRFPCCGTSETKNHTAPPSVSQRSRSQGTSLRARRGLLRSAAPAGNPAAQGRVLVREAGPCKSLSAQNVSDLPYLPDLRRKHSVDGVPRCPRSVSVPVQVGQVGQVGPGIYFPWLTVPYLGPTVRPWVRGTGHFTRTGARVPGDPSSAGQSQRAPKRASNSARHSASSGNSQRRTLESPTFGRLSNSFEPNTRASKAPSSVCDERTSRPPPLRSESAKFAVSTDLSTSGHHPISPVKSRPSCSLSNSQRSRGVSERIFCFVSAAVFGAHLSSIPE